MLELLDLFGGTIGERMELDDYYVDFERAFWGSAGLGFWKLERQQVFREPNYDSWTAFARGNWEESLRILEAGRDDMVRYHQRIAEHGFFARRVRVVEEPISAYLQWELHALRVRDECGGSVRVIAPEHIKQFESNGPLPEIYTLGSAVMYQAVYDEEAVLESVRRFTDRALILRCQKMIENLYQRAEPLPSYFARRVAPLPPPPGQP